MTEKEMKKRNIKYHIWDISNASYFIQYEVEDSKLYSKMTTKMIMNRLKKIREITGEIEILTQR